MKTAKWLSLEFEHSGRLDPQHVGVIVDFVATLTKSQNGKPCLICTLMFQWITKSHSHFGAYGIDLAPSCHATCMHDIWRPLIT